MMIFYIRINSVLHSLMGNTKRMSDTQHSRVTQNSVYIKTPWDLPIHVLFLTSTLTYCPFYYYYTFALPRMLYSWNLTVQAYHFFSFLPQFFFSLSYLLQNSSSKTTSLCIPLIFNSILSF